MKVYQTNEIKNISILGSSGSGKTTLAEAMLYEGGVIKRRGSVEAGNTVSDYFPVEKEYGYSVFSTVFSVEWQDRKLNFIDCPGSDDFVGGAVSALNVTDTALMVLNAQYGVEVGTVNQFRYTEQFHKPVIFVVNQLDNDKADYEGTIAQLKDRWGSKIVPIQYPISCGSSFNAVADVLKMKMYRWKPEGGVPEVLEIPAEEMDKAMELHKALVESAAEHDDMLMEKFFEEGTLSEDDMRAGIRAGLVIRGMFPVFCVCAGRDMCVRRTLEFLGNVVPCTDKMPRPVTTEGVEVTPDSNGPTSLFFFKTTVEPHIGQVSYFKVISGKVKEGDDLLNADRGSKERIAQLFSVAGQTRNAVTEMVAGDIGATVKLKGTNQGTISDVNGNFVLKTGGNRELAVDYIGYESVTLPADTTKSLLIAMNEDQATLDEVVVVGYGSQSKGSITGAVASLKMSGTPQPTIGRKAFRKYLKESLVHPSDKDCARAKGKVILTFRVDKEGRPQDITVKKGLCASADEEAIRLIEEGPDWTMGEEPVEISIRF